MRDFVNILTCTEVIFGSILAYSTSNDVEICLAFSAFILIFGGSPPLPPMGENVSGEHGEVCLHALAMYCSKLIETKNVYTGSNFVYVNPTGFFQYIRCVRARLYVILWN